VSVAELAVFHFIVYVCFRKDLVPFENCKIIFVDEIFAIEKPGTQINLFHLAADESAPSMRKTVTLKSVTSEI